MLNLDLFTYTVDGLSIHRYCNLNIITLSFSHITTIVVDLFVVFVPVFMYGNISDINTRDNNDCLFPNISIRSPSITFH